MAKNILRFIYYKYFTFHNYKIYFTSGNVSPYDSYMTGCFDIDSYDCGYDIRRF